MELALEHLRSGPLVPRVEAALRAALAGGRWEVGHRLPNEAELARELGVGRSSVREAVRLLARDGLLDVRHGVGTFVARTPAGRDTVDERLRRARLLEVYEVRRALEVEAARLAAERSLPEERAELGRLFAEHQAHSPQAAAEFVDTDLAFHLAVVELSRNAVLLDLFTAALPILRTALVEMIENEPGLPDTSCAHLDLLAALEAGDAAAATAATLDNLEVVIHYIRAQEATR